MCSFNIYNKIGFSVMKTFLYRLKTKDFHLKLIKWTQTPRVRTQIPRKRFLELKKLILSQKTK